MYKGSDRCIISVLMSVKPNSIVVGCVTRKKNKFKTKVFKNNVADSKALDIWLTSLTKAAPSEITVLMEATGIYHENLAHYLF